MITEIKDTNLTKADEQKEQLKRQVVLHEDTILFISLRTNVEAFLSDVTGNLILQRSAITMPLKEVRRLQERIHCSGAETAPSCIVEKVIHTKNICPSGVSSDRKCVTKLKRTTRDAVQPVDLWGGCWVSGHYWHPQKCSWTFLLVVLFVAILHGDALHAPFPDRGGGFFQGQPVPHCFVHLAV